MSAPGLVTRAELAVLIRGGTALQHAAEKVLSGDIRGARARVERVMADLTAALPELARLEAEQDARGCYLDAVDGVEP